MTHHWSLCFLVSPCYLQDAMPCQWSSSDLPRVLRIWESVFYSQAFFTLHFFLLVLRLRWGQQFNLKVSRVLCWSLKHSPGPAICLNHSNPQKRYGGRFYLRVTAGRLSNEESVSYRIWTLFAIGEHARSLMLYPFGHRAMRTEVIKAPVLVVICVLEVLSCNIVMTNISIHEFATILLWW